MRGAVGLPYRFRRLCATTPGDEAPAACPALICANCNHAERLRVRPEEGRTVATRCETTAAAFLGVLCLAATADWLARQQGLNSVSIEPTAGHLTHPAD